MTVTVRSVVDLDLPGPTISRHLYGHFAEHLGRCVYGGFWVGEDSPVPNIRGIRRDVVEALRELAIPNLRWPGGCFADEYHWRDGIGPREQRPRMVNTHWGNVEENNHFGTHEFLDLCELLGAEPYICGNVGSGTVREMSEWVEYITRDGSSPMVDLRRANGRDRPWRVRFWGVGNENWGCGGNMRAEQYADLARQYGTYCRDHGDNKLYRIAGGANSDDYHWTEALMRQLGDLGCGCRPHDHYQAISLHYYTIAGTWEDKGSATTFGADDYLATIAAARNIDTLLTRHGTVMDCYDPDRRIGLVLDEWGTWWDVEPGTNPGFLFQQNTMRDALVAGLHLNTFHRHAHRLVMANIAQTVNVLQAMLLTDGDTLIRTPTFHVFAMNAGHHDASALTVHHRDPDLPLFSASASTKDGNTLLSVANLDPDATTVWEADLRGRTVTTAYARLLHHDDVAAHNTAQAPDTVSPTDHEVELDQGTLRVELPPRSFATVSLRLR